MNQGCLTVFVLKLFTPVTNESNTLNYPVPPDPLKRVFVLVWLFILFKPVFWTAFISAVVRVPGRSTKLMLASEF